MISTNHESLRAYIAVYAMERGLAASSQKALGYVVNSFEGFLGRTALLSDLSQHTVNGWLQWMFGNGLDPETIRNRRTATLGIWKHAVESDLLQVAPARIRKVKVPDKPPECWDLETEFRKLLAVAKDLQGHMNKDRRVKRADFWSAWLYVDYGTGYRLGDLRRFRFDQIRHDGTTQLVQSKTGEVVLGYIEPAGMRLIRRIHTPDRVLVFGSLVNHSNAQRYMRKLIKLAGLRGSTKWIRRTGATWSEVTSPGSAQSYLGHKTPRVAWKSYIDRRFLQKKRPRPPKLGG